MQENVEDVNVIQQKSLPQQKAQGLEAALEGVTKRLEALELRLNHLKYPNKYSTASLDLQDNGIAGYVENQAIYKGTAL